MGGLQVRIAQRVGAVLVRTESRPAAGLLQTADR